MRFSMPPLLIHCWMACSTSSHVASPTTATSKKSPKTSKLALSSMEESRQLIQLLLGLVFILGKSRSTGWKDSKVLKKIYLSIGSQGREDEEDDKR